MKLGYEFIFPTFYECINIWEFYYFRENIIDGKIKICHIIRTYLNGIPFNIVIDVFKNKSQICI